MAAPVVPKMSEAFFTFANWNHARNKRFLLEKKPGEEITALIEIAPTQYYQKEHYIKLMNDIINGKISANKVSQTEIDNLFLLIKKLPELLIPLQKDKTISPRTEKLLLDLESVIKLGALSPNENQLLTFVRNSWGEFLTRPLDILLKRTLPQQAASKEIAVSILLEKPTLAKNLLHPPRFWQIWRWGETNYRDQLAATDWNKLRTKFPNDETINKAWENSKACLEAKKPENSNTSIFSSLFNGFLNLFSAKKPEVKSTVTTTLEERPCDPIKNVYNDPKFQAPVISTEIKNEVLANPVPAVVYTDDLNKGQNSDPIPTTPIKRTGPAIQVKLTPTQDTSVKRQGPAIQVDLKQPQENSSRRTKPAIDIKLELQPQETSTTKKPPAITYYDINPPAMVSKFDPPTKTGSSSSKNIDVPKNLLEYPEDNDSVKIEILNSSL